MIRKTPIVEGLSKNKLTLVATALGVVVVGTIIYVLNRDPSSSTSTPPVEPQHNYAPNTGNADMKDILGAGHKKASQAVAAKAVASQPAVRVQLANTPDQSQLQKQQQAEQALLNSMRAPLTSNQVKPQGVEAAVKSDASQTMADDGLAKDDPNQMAEKRAFIKTNSKVADSSLKDRISDYVLAIGTKIPAQLDQDINSDLPGQIYAHVSRDVYDSRTHSVLLMPAGSNLVGTYDSSVAYGQERLLVAWTRVNLPNGQFIDLPGFGGADALGAGFGDKVDNHYDKIGGAVLLTSILAAGAQLAQPQQSNALQSPGVGQTLGQAVGTQIAQTGTQLVQKDLNLQPTLHIRPGFEFTVEVNKDMVFPGKYTGNAAKS